MKINRNGETVSDTDFIEVPDEETLAAEYHVIALGQDGEYGPISKGVEIFYTTPTKKQILWAIHKHDGDSAEVRVVHRLEL